MAKQSYEGGCQCGKVRYRVDTDLDQTFSCNCSRCRRLGSILSFSDVDDFELLGGGDALSEYRFNHNRIAHLFCATCGIQSFARGQRRDGTPMIAVNARCLDGVDPQALAPTFVDGQSF